MMSEEAEAVKVEAKGAKEEVEPAGEAKEGMVAFVVGGTGAVGMVRPRSKAAMS